MNPKEESRKGKGLEVSKDR